MLGQWTGDLLFVIFCLCLSSICFLFTLSFSSSLTLKSFPPSVFSIFSLLSCSQFIFPFACVSRYFCLSKFLLCHRCLSVSLSVLPSTCPSLSLSVFNKRLSFHFCLSVLLVSRRPSLSPLQSASPHLLVSISRPVLSILLFSVSISLVLSISFFFSLCLSISHSVHFSLPFCLSLSLFFCLFFFSLFVSISHTALPLSLPFYLSLSPTQSFPLSLSTFLPPSPSLPPSVYLSLSSASHSYLRQSLLVSKRINQEPVSLSRCTY